MFTTKNPQASLHSWLVMLTAKIQEDFQKHILIETRIIVTKRMCVVYYLWIVCFLSFILRSLLCARLSKLRVDSRIRCYKYLSIKQDVLSHFIINLSYLSVDCDRSEFFCNKKINKTRYLTHGRVLRSHYYTVINWSALMVRGYIVWQIKTFSTFRMVLTCYEILCFLLK